MLTYEQIEQLLAHGVPVCSYTGVEVRSAAEISSGNFQLHGYRVDPRKASVTLVTWLQLPTASWVVKFHVEGLDFYFVVAHDGTMDVGSATEVAMDEARHMRWTLEQSQPVWVI